MAFLNQKIYVPKEKYQLVDAILKMKAEWKRYKVTKLKKKQLYAIYFKLRKAEDVDLTEY